MKLSLHPIYNFFGGTTETYAAFFTVVATILAFHNLLTGAFVGAIGAITTLITANDVHNDLQNANLNQNQNVTNVVVNTPPASPGGSD